MLDNYVAQVTLDQCRHRFQQRIWELDAKQTPLTENEKALRKANPKELAQNLKTNNHDGFNRAVQLNKSSGLWLAGSLISGLAATALVGVMAEFGLFALTFTATVATVATGGLALLAIAWIACGILSLYKLHQYSKEQKALFDNELKRLSAANNLPPAFSDRHS